MRKRATNVYFFAARRSKKLKMSCLQVRRKLNKNILMLEKRELVQQYISIVKPTRCTIASNLFYFGITQHVVDGLSVHHQEFTTGHTAIGKCQTGTATAC